MSGSATEAASRNPRPTCGKRAAPPRPVFRDKTFFFGSYQRFTDQSTITSSNIRYPSAKMIAGDFSEFQGQLYHPITKLPIPNNNLAAAGLVDPVAQGCRGELIPTVARLGDRLVWDYTTPAENQEFLAKIDHNLSMAQRLNFSYFTARVATPWSYRAARPGIPNMRWAPTRWRRIQFQADTPGR